MASLEYAHRRDLRIESGAGEATKRTPCRPTKRKIQNGMKQTESEECRLQRLRHTQIAIANRGDAVSHHSL